MNFGRVLAETLKALRDSDVPAIVVGGVAIAAHGVVRGTQDLDLAVASIDADAAVAALESLGVRDDSQNGRILEPLSTRNR